jgi:hypothetical protein
MKPSADTPLSRKIAEQLRKDIEASPGMYTTHPKRDDCAFVGVHNTQGCGMWAKLGVPAKVDENGNYLTPEMEALKYGRSFPNAR